MELKVYILIIFFHLTKTFWYNWENLNVDSVVGNQGITLIFILDRITAYDL